MSANQSNSDAPVNLDPEIEKKVVAFTNYCFQQMVEGVSHDSIKRDLMARGVAPELADLFIGQAAEVLTKRLANWHNAATSQQLGQQTPSASMTASKAPSPVVQPENPKKEAAKWQMLIGCVALGLGGLITFASYGMSEPGGKYILAYGAIIVGGWNVISGLWKYGTA